MSGHMLPSENFAKIGPQRDYVNRYHAPVGQAKFAPSKHKTFKQGKKKLKLYKGAGKFSFHMRIVYGV